MFNVKTLKEFHLANYQYEAISILRVQVSLSYKYC